MPLASRTSLRLGRPKKPYQIDTMIHRVVNSLVFVLVACFVLEWVASAPDVHHRIVLKTRRVNKERDKDSHTVSCFKIYMKFMHAYFSDLLPL